MPIYTHEGLETLFLPPREQVRSTLVEVGLKEDVDALINHPAEEVQIRYVRAELSRQQEPLPVTAQPLPQQELQPLPADAPKEVKTLHELLAKRKVRLMAA